MLKWDEAGGKILEAGAAATYLITGTVGPNACNKSTANVGEASYGCSASDICLATPVTASVTYTTQPAFTISAADATLDQCGGGPVIIDFANNGARAQNVVVTYTLPAGLIYNGLDAGSDPTTTLIYSPALGATGTITWMYSVIDTLVTTNTLRFNVKNDPALCATPGALGPNTADMRYQDTCGNPFNDVAASSNTITVQASNISATQTPLTRQVVFNQVYTWTINITNTGNSPTNNLVVTETLGNGWQFVAAGAGSPGGAVPTVAGNVITWVVGSLAAGASWSATFSARALDAATDYRTTLTATTACNDGGCLQARSYVDYASALNHFIKSRTPGQATIGDLVTFTVAADLFGNVPYTSTILTDALPSALGYVSATLRLTTDRDGDSGGPTTTIVAPTSAPSVGATGNVVWNLGTLSGAISMTAIITAVVRNVAANSPYQGQSYNNVATLTYRDDGQSYSASSTASVTIIEPIIHIGKSYVTPSACRALLFEDNFNDGNSAGWTTVGTGWSVTSNALRNNANDTNRLATADASGGANYSLSAMLFSTDSSGDMGLIFRFQDQNNYYRFAWNRGGTNNYRLEKVVAGSASTLGSPAGAAYDTNRWYHVEVRAVGNAFTVFINGVQALSASDPANSFPSGRVGAYANNQNAASFDDFLVTRLDDAGCTVAAGDLITYTLTISNQGQAAGRELVITDAIPTGTSLYTYTFLSSDPAASVTAAPTPIPGATGNLVWNIGQLAPISPFVTSAHSAITLTVVLSVTPDIPARSFLTNQVSMTYDTQAGSGPAGVQRAYSGGSHSATVQTVSPPGILKARDPITATIGQYVFYTLTVPSTPITAALHNITVTDPLPPNLALVGAPAISGGVGGTNLSVGDVLTVTFARIDANTQATIAYTAVVRNIAANQDGVTVTNTASLAWQDGAGAAQTPLTATTTFTVVEPLLAISKVAAPSSDLQAGDEITYTITVSHAADSHATAYDVVVQDIIPDVLTYKSGTLDAPGAAATFESSQQISATYAALPPGASLVLTYVVTVDQAAQASSLLTNTAVVSHTSLPGDNPDERTGSGIAANDYYTSTAAPVSTLAATAAKALVEDRLYTIGEAITYTLSLTVPAGTVHSAVITDFVPAGLRYDPAASFLSITAPFTLPAYAITQDPVGGGDGSAASTFTLSFNDTLTNTTGGPAAVVLTFRLIVADVAASNHGDTKVNTATLTYLDADGNVETQTVSAAAITLTEPTLVIEKSVAPTNVRPGDTVFYTLRIYHAPTSTVPAYNVQVSDTLAAWLSYISGSWETNNSPTALAATGQYTVELPDLEAYFPVIGTSINAGNPLILRYQAVVKIDTPVGTIITNTGVAQWTSLPTDPFGDTRTGAGGVDDYRTSDEAQISLDQFTIAKTGPLTVTAGSIVTYVITVSNGSPITGTNARVVDTISFRVSEVTGTFATPLQAGLCSAPIPVARGSEIVCQLGDLPPYAQGVVTITGRIASDAPDGALVDDYADFFITDSNGVEQQRTDEAETQVETLTDLEIGKIGPATAAAGELITYTLVVTNNGPSTARGVDAKDILPAGLTFVSGSTTQGACISSICQIGDLEPGGVVTMVITASVGSDVTGVITNTGQVFSATPDEDQANNRATVETTVSAYAALYVAKVDMTDPVYAGNTYFYQVSVTNTGPAQANNVVITDILPAHVVFEGASPGCTYADGRVTCAAGDLAPGEWFGALINVRVPVTISDNTLVTNTATITTTSNIIAGSSILTATEPTLLRQTTNNPTDLVISKDASPAQAAAGLAGGNLITYTLVVTNAGPAAATAVQVTDLYPPEFVLLSATTSKPAGEAQCSNGGVCDLGELGIGASAVITLVFAVPADVASGIYTNTAHVGSAGPDSDLSNNTASAAVEVLNNAVLQVRKVANPATATAGDALAYTILVTNTGPSDAANVTVSETLPAGFTLALVTPSQGGCVAFPCNLGTIVAGGNASIYLYGTVSTSVTGTLTNTVAVTSTTPGAGATYTLTTPITGTADLALIKAATATARPGDPITYTLTVYNLGPSEAQSVRITDTLPISVVFSSATTGCAHDGGTVTCALSSLAAGASSSFVITVTAAADITPGTSLENRAVVGSSTSDPNPLNNAATADTSVVGAADLVISKVGAPAAVVAGEYVTYTLRITNAGPGLARSVDVKDQLPAGLSLVTISASDAGVCGGTVCQFGTLPAGATRTVTVVARVNADTPAGSVTNTAAVYSTDESDQSDNTTTADTTITTSADLSIVKMASPDPAVPGQSLTYILTVANAGPSDAQDVTVTDTLPAGFTPTSVRSSQAACSALPCALGTIPAGGSATVTIVGTVAATVTTSLTNLAGVTSSTADPNPANNSTTLAMPVSPTADVGVTLRSPPTTVAGGTATVIATVYNNGSSDALGTVVTITLPPSTTFDSATLPPGWFARDNGDGTVTITTTNPLPAGDAVGLPITVIVDPAVPTGTSLEFAAVVGASTPDSNPRNNEANADTSVIARADLGLTKVGLPTTVTAGELITYALVIHNFGPSRAIQVKLVDSLPAGLTLLSVTPGPPFPPSLGGQGGCAGLICLLGDMMPNETTTVTVVARVNPNTDEGVVLLNAAYVSSETTDPGPNPNIATTVNTVQTEASLQIEKHDLADPVAPDAQLIYAIVVTNTGPSEARDVIVTDQLPAGVTFLGSTDSCAETASGLLDCRLGTLAAGSVTRFLVSVRVAATVVSGTTLINSVSVTSTTPLTRSTLSDTEPTTVLQTFGPPADLAVAKTPSGAVVTAGGRITYTLVITNYGPATATDVELADALPAGLTLISATPSQGACDNAGVCFLGSLIYAGAPSTATVLIVAEASPALAAGTILTNTAQVHADQPDPVPANNSTVAAVTVAATADLAIAKRGAPDPAVAGDLLRYTVVVTNSGPSAAVAVFVTDTLPAGVTFVAGSTCTAGAGNLVICSLGDLAAGATTSFEIVVSVAPTATGVLTNVAVVGSTTPDPNPSNNTAIHAAPLVASADLSIVKTTSAETVVAGELFTYTLVARNAGPSAATDVVITDRLPSGVTFVSAAPPQTAGPNPLIWRLAGLAVNETRTFTIAARVEADVAAGTLLRNSADIGAATPDPNEANNSDQASAQTVAHASVTITKTAAPDPAVAGEPLTYTITLHNGGPSDASRVDVKELLPQGLTLQQLIASQGVCVGLICQLGDLPVSRTVVITAVTVVDPNLPPGTQLCNTAAAFSNTPQPGGTTGPITGTMCVTTTTSADVTIAKRAQSPTPTPPPISGEGPGVRAVAGELLTYTLVVANLGPSTAMSVTVTDTLPAEVTFVAAEPAADSGPNPLLWNLGALAVGQTRLITVTTRVNAWVTQAFTNTAGIVSATGDPNPGNNGGTQPVRPMARADLSLVKQMQGAGAVAGGPLTYTLIVRNAGPSDATNVRVTDTLPAEVRFDAATPAPSSGPNPLIWELGVLPAGASRTITVHVTIGSWVTQTFTNTAIVGSTTADPNPDDNGDSAPTAPPSWPT